jgi:hypothetical protein
MLGLFNVVVPSIVQETRRLLRTIPDLSHVFLVGGLSESAVVRDAITKATSEAEWQRKVHVVIPPHPSLAVLTGAAKFGLNPNVICERVVKRTYGISISNRYDDKIHVGRPRVQHKYGGEMHDFCSCVFEPFCLAGDKMDVNHVIRRNYLPSEDDQKILTVEIFETGTSRSVKFADDPDAKSLGRITLDTPFAPGMGSAPKRNMSIAFHFGRTEIEIETVDPVSGNKKKATLVCDDTSLVSPLFSTT